MLIIFEIAFNPPAFVARCACGDIAAASSSFFFFAAALAASAAAFFLCASVVSSDELEDEPPEDEPPELEPEPDDDDDDDDEDEEEDDDEDEDPRDFPEFSFPAPSPSPSESEPESLSLSVSVAPAPAAAPPAPPPSYPSCRKHAFTTSLPTTPNFFGDSRVAASNACVTLVGSPLRCLYSPLYTRANNTPIARRSITGFGALDSASSAGASALSLLIFFRISPKRSIFPTLSSVFFCASFTPSTTGLTLRMSVLSDCVSSFSTALMNELVIFKFFANVTLRIGGLPRASPP